MKRKYNTSITCPHCDSEISMSISDEKLKENIESEAMKSQRAGLIARMTTMRKKISAYKQKYGELPD